MLRSETAARVESAGAKVTLVGADVGDPDADRSGDRRPDHRHDAAAAWRRPRRRHRAGRPASWASWTTTSSARSSGSKAAEARSISTARPPAWISITSSASRRPASLPFGNPGQSNYGAANAFIDRLAWLRQSQGRPGLTVNWNQWSEIEALAWRSPQPARAFDFRGAARSDPERGVEALGLADPGWARQKIAIMPMDWVTFHDPRPRARSPTRCFEGHPRDDGPRGASRAVRRRAPCGRCCSPRRPRIATGWSREVHSRPSWPTSCKLDRERAPARPAAQHRRGLRLAHGARAEEQGRGRAGHQPADREPHPGSVDHAAGDRADGTAGGVTQPREETAGTTDGVAASDRAAPAATRKPCRSARSSPRLSNRRARAEPRS